MDAQEKRGFLVMAKPAGSRCNLACDYCYYLGKEARLPKAEARMSEALLERYIAQSLQASPGPRTHFEWHGGEPCLMGLAFFRRVVELQKALCSPGREITNGLQTNGLLIDAQWARFLAREGFSVGLSLDGPADLHDSHRRDSSERPSHAQVLRAYRLLREQGVFVNILCVLHEGNAREGERVYGFFRELGAKHLQFLPLVTSDRAMGRSPFAASPETIGEFLCGVFDLWIARDVGRIVIQNIDEALRPIYGISHALCVHRETCGDVAVLERDGGFYACDHFVEGEHLIGNIRERDLASLACDPRMIAFGLAKRDSLPRTCIECGVLAFCNGGCPKDRLVDGLNYLCPAYKRYFTHVQPELTRLAAHMKAGLKLRDFAPSTPALGDAREKPRK